MSKLLAIGLGKLLSRVFGGKKTKEAAKEIVGNAKSELGSAIDKGISKLPIENQTKQGLPSGAEAVDQGIGIAKRVLLDPTKNQAKKKVLK